MSPSQQSQLIVLEELPEELFGNISYNINLQKESFIYFLFATCTTYISWRASSYFLHTKCIPALPTLAPHSSQYSMLAMDLLQLVLPTGAAESWEVTTSARYTEMRQRKEKIIPVSPWISILKYLILKVQ